MFFFSLLLFTRGLWFLCLRFLSFYTAISGASDLCTRLERAPSSYPLHTLLYSTYSTLHTQSYSTVCCTLHTLFYSPVYCILNTLLYYAVCILHAYLSICVLHNLLFRTIPLLILHTLLFCAVYRILIILLSTKQCTKNYAHP